MTASGLRPVRHPASTESSRRRLAPAPFGTRIGLIAAVALVLRLLYVFVIAPDPVGVGGDASFYHSAANLIADGHFYYRRIFGHAYPTALHPPLYPLLLSVVSLLGGVHVLPHRLVGIVVGTGSVALLGVLGKRVDGERAGLLAASIAAVYPPFVTADGSVMSEPLYVLILVVALLLALRLHATPSVKLAVALGAVIGLGILTRTEALFLLAFLAWPLRRHARLLALTVLATVVVISPWVIRNAVVFHKLELAANYSTVASAANCHDTYYGHDIGWWSLDCLARARTRRQLLIGDASPQPGLRYARTHPARAALVAAVRVLRTFSFYQPLRIGNHEPRRRWLDALGLAIYYPLLVLAAIGLLRLPGRRWLLLAPVWTVIIVSVTGWGNSRFRIGADVALVVLAAVALSSVSTPTSRRRAPIPAA
jgi:4-amino-4-deoxy-L-arabinose transferase-like glycosyltransferase